MLPKSELQSRPLILERSPARKHSKRSVILDGADNMTRIEESIREDIALLRASPLIKQNTQVIGLKYDIHTGLLSPVEEGPREL